MSVAKASVELRAESYRCLGDPVRLRLLRLLARERLNVGELTRILGIAQSGVSRHVRLLREGGFVEEARVGGWTWLALAEEAPAGLGPVWAAFRAALDAAPDAHGDDARLAEVRREREERRVGWGRGARPAEPGRSWAAWARALGHLLPPAAVADLGCGAGALTREIARWARHVVAVDSDRAALERARVAGRRAKLGNVSYVEAALHDLPLDDESVDVVLLSQILHAVDDPDRVVCEAFRIAKRGGRLLVLDLLPHDEAWVRDLLGHRRLGFEGDALAARLERAGCRDVTWEEVGRRRGNPFVVLLASGRRPEREAAS